MKNIITRVIFGVVCFTLAFGCYMAICTTQPQYVLAISPVPSHPAMQYLFAVASILAGILAIAGIPKSE